MSGQATPPRLVEPFAKNAGPAYITNPIPTPSQIAVADGRASLNDGFPPLCFIDRTLGGVPPYGSDFNGILYMLSAWVAYLAAGQLPVFDATLAAAMSGYAIGARLSKTDGSGATWTNLVDGNATNPDTGGAGWLSSVVLRATSAPSAGTHADNALAGVSDYVLDVDTSAGAIELDGFVAQRNGQRLTLRKSTSDANVLTIGAGAGTAANQLQAVGNFALANQYASLTIQYLTAISRWVVV